MPLANSFLRSLDEAAAEPRFPLALVACATCGLVQLDYVVPAPVLYRDYIYVSSTSDAVRTHAEALASSLSERYALTPSDLIVEIASNDGTVLQAFQRLGLTVLGVEPARNIAAIAERVGVPTVPEFFDAALAGTVATAYQRAAVILARHVFAHVDDVHDFITGATDLLDDDGVLAIEVPYLSDMLEGLEFDTVYHEHLSYFAVSQFAALARDHGLRVVDVERVNLHGGSILVHIRRGSFEASPSVARMIEDEDRRQLWSPANLARFANGVRAWRSRFEDFIAEVVGDSGIVIGYGAAAKANTLLNYCPSAAASLQCILDRSPHKHGRYTPGTHRLVRPVEEWRDTGATHMVVLAWNFKDEIMRQMAPFAAAGGRFIVPLPSPVLV